MGKERFPGRRGGGRDIFVLPLTFSEYERFIKKRNIKQLTFEPERIEEIFRVNRVFRKKFEEDFQDYLITGGFPLAIKEFHEHGRTVEAEKTYLDWLKTDLLKSNKMKKPQRRY